MTIDTSTQAVEALLEGLPEGPWRDDEYGSYVWAKGEKGDFTPLQSVRGWGYYTGRGSGALGLSESQGIAIQKIVCRFSAASRELVPALLSERDAAIDRAESAEARLRRIVEIVLSNATVETPDELLSAANAAIEATS